MKRSEFRYLTFLLVLLYLSSLALVSAPCIWAMGEPEAAVSPQMPERPLAEVWGYLMEGAESAYSGNEPVTDLCYFRAIIDYKGQLIGAVKIPESVPLKKNVRRHLVVAELSNRTLEHFTLSPSYRFRKKLIADIAEAARWYDGVQIDFEAVPDADSLNYRSFIADVKKSIGGKTVSVAVPARHQKVNDAYDYAALNSVADRIVVMAYDEHWKGSSPGPIASLEWGEKVARYASSCIPGEKLVIGIPLYGRSWQRHGYSREISYAEAEKIISQSGGKPEADGNGYPMFRYSKPVDIVLYYENSRSILDKVQLYLKHEIRSVAFWRLGQEPDDLWDNLRSGERIGGE